MQVYLIQLFSPQKNSFMRFLSLLLCLQYFIWVYYEHAKTVMLTMKLLPTIFNLQKCYHPVSFICEWSMPLYKIKRKEKYSGIEAELSLLVYLLYLFMVSTLRTTHTSYSQFWKTVSTKYLISPQIYQAQNIYRIRIA